MTLMRNISRIQVPRNGIQYVFNQETIEELKPIVFFDAGKFTKNDDDLTIGFHPHSGIGIITYFHGTDLYHQDSSNNNGIIYDGGAQWIRAGGGVWHEESYRRKHESPPGPWTGSIHQLWIQLPAEFEESPVEYANISKEDLPGQENVKILAGKYKSQVGKMNVPLNMTYLDVALQEGEEWYFDTPAGQSTGFIFIRDGSLQIGDRDLENSSMGILEHNEGQIKVKALSPITNFVLVIAEPNNNPIVSSGSQIHTNREALERSSIRIQKLRKNIKLAK